MRCSHVKCRRRRYTRCAGEGALLAAPATVNYFRSAGRAQRVRWGLLIGLLVMRGVSLVGVSQSEVGINSNSNSNHGCMG